jgi:HSP20 family protein
MVAGVQPDNLSITITRDMITIKGKREENQSIDKENYFVQELYWGSFSRTISLPEEVDPEEAEAVERHGLLIIKLPKLDKNRETKLKIKSI